VIASGKPGHHGALRLEERHRHRVFAVAGLHHAGVRGDAGGDLTQAESGGVHEQQPALVIDVVAQPGVLRPDFRLADDPVIDAEPVLVRLLVPPLLLRLVPSQREPPSCVVGPQPQKAAGWHKSALRRLPGAPA
jgi:hypothetical protein